MSDCRECGKPVKKDEKPRNMYKECKGKPWYSPGDIRYCPLQVLWMIEHFFWLSGAGIMSHDWEWPPDPDSAGNDLPNVQTSRRAGAYFEKPIDAIAELAIRLKNLGRSGELLLAELQAGMEGNLTSEADAAFHYITGNSRKVDSYPHWKADRKYNNKGKNTQIRQKLDKPTRHGV